MNLVSIGPRACCAVALAVLTGCTSIPADRGRGDVDDWVRARGRVLAPDVDRDVASLVRNALRQPLTADAAVRIALLQNPELRATYARLGLASADLYEAGRLSNPRLSASLLQSSVDGERLTLGLAQTFTDLLLLPARSRLGIARFTQMKQDVAHEVSRLAARVEQSHFNLVGAQQIAAMRELTATAAAASAELAQRFHAAGNIKQLELARERAAASEARLTALAAQSEVVAARSAYARILGLQPGMQWSVESALTAPPAAEEDVENLVALAQTSRLDLAAARGRIESMADAERTARRSRWFGDVEVGVEREREPGGERLTGPKLQLELPVFNLRAGAPMRAASELERSRAELAGLELDVAHEVRLAHARTLAAKGRAEEFRAVLIPAREAIVARTQEEQNFMLVGQFELLAAKQAEYDAYGGYLESVRDYWLARVELAQAVGTRLPGAPESGATVPIAVPEPDLRGLPPPGSKPTPGDEDPQRHHHSSGGAP